MEYNSSKDPMLMGMGGTAKLETCKGDTTQSDTNTAQSAPQSSRRNFQGTSDNTQQTPNTQASYLKPQSSNHSYSGSHFSSTTPTTTCPTIASALWRPLWPPGWHPRGSSAKSYRQSTCKGTSSTICKEKHYLPTNPLMKMSTREGHGNLSENEDNGEGTSQHRCSASASAGLMKTSDVKKEEHENTALHYSEGFDQIEDWLDENPLFVQDYFLRKASRSTVDAWMLSRSVPFSTSLAVSNVSPGNTSANVSGATTPVRKISASEFDKGLVLRPMVSTTHDGTPTFLPICTDVDNSYKAPTKTRQELEALDEKELIFELVKDICNDLDIRSLCHKILKNVSVLTNADRCSLFLVKGEKDDPNRCLVSQLFDVSSQSTIEQMEDKEEITVPWGKGIVGYVAESGVPVNISDCYQDSRFTDMVDQKTGYTTRNMLCNPILDIHGAVTGVAQVINKKATPTFTKNDEQVFEHYLQFCGIGLRNAQLYEKSQLENKRNQVLLDLARMVFEEQSTIEHVVYRIMLHTQSLLECQRCQVLLVREDNSTSDISTIEAYRTSSNYFESSSDKASTNPTTSAMTKCSIEDRQKEQKIEDNELKRNNCRSFARVFDLESGDLIGVDHDNRKSPFEGRFPINIGITGYVAATGETVNIPDAYKDTRFDPSVDEDPTRFKHKSILCMPILNANHRIIGVSQLVNKMSGKSIEPFNSNDENLFHAFSIFCGMGIHNTQMYERAVKAMAKQRVTLEVLSYHASAPFNEARKLSQMTIPSTSAMHLGDIRFNDFSLDEDSMNKACMRMFLDLDLVERFHIDYTVLCRWILSVRKNYRQVTYHNWRHAFNVAQMMFAILTNTQWCSILGELETLALLVACLCHDLDHRGTNNSFQIKSCSPLAQLYSTSTLEHHHFDQSLMILNSQGNQILAHLSPEEYCRVIQVLEEAILATDLAVYFRRRGDFFQLIESEEYDWSREKDRSLLRGMLMTACDIAAITKPWEIQRVTAELVASEFFQQGDIEKEELNIEPIDMMNREKCDELPKMQVAFIDAICLPVYDVLAKMNPTHLKSLYEGLISNREAWQMLSDQPYFRPERDL